MTMPDPPPVTPSHHPPSALRPAPKLRDSPFSDYFTDDGRSPDSSAAAAPSPATQQLLLRLSRLQSQVVRGEQENAHDIVGIVERKVVEMELELDSMHSQTRTMVELADSGVFSDEEEDDDDGQVSQHTSQFQTPSKHVDDDPFTGPLTPEHRRAEHDYLILEAQRILASVQTAETKLRARHAELRDLNDKYNTQVDEVARRLEELDRQGESVDEENEALQNENRELKKSLKFDETELLWLRLQFKALEVEIRESDRGAERLEGYAPELKGEIQEVKRERWGKRMRGWEEDWKNVVRRFGARRREWSLLNDELRGGEEWLEDVKGDMEEEWGIEMVKEGGGRARRIILTRIPSEGGKPLVDDQQDVEDEDVEDVQVFDPETTDAATIAIAEPASPLPYTNNGTQTDLDRASSQTSSWLFAEGDMASEAALDDCAITTSEEETVDEGDDPKDGVDEVQKSPRLASAWQELWTGLTHLAGMGEED